MDGVVGEGWESASAVGLHGSPGPSDDTNSVTDKGVRSATARLRGPRTE
jgi:hypothetical protein